ncbi:hypothetical protein [uncultured Brevundimonas sp.]|uniref:hypothetical protein n=1 Tax=uncultured Brevundimonas sp. TaxID=213418 RepID=UPI0025ED6FC4|nr:hypothetical protein [uncultured Brevundimonas sp.]
MAKTVEKTEDELLAERQSLAEQTAAVDRQIAAKKLVKVQAFADVLKDDALAALIVRAQEAAEALTDNPSGIAANWLTVVRGTPGLIAGEIDRLTAEATEPKTPQPAATTEA